MNFMKNSHWRDNRGFAFIFLVVALPLMLILFFSLLRFSRFIERKIKLQNGIDVALLSGTTVLAEGLNQISKLNLKLEHYHRLYAAARAGRWIHGGVKIAEIVIRKKIEAIALKQEFVKIRFPIFATQKTVELARKNGTLHIFLFPLKHAYPIQRDPPRNGLPNVYTWQSKASVMGEDEAAGRRAIVPTSSKYVGGDRRPRTKYTPINEALPWQIFGYYYRRSYTAHSKAALFGTDLLHATWRGYVIE